jgi:hypothetical protein
MMPASNSCFAHPIGEAVYVFEIFAESHIYAHCRWNIQNFALIFFEDV